MNKPPLDETTRALARLRFTKALAGLIDENGPNDRSHEDPPAAHLRPRSTIFNRELKSDIELSETMPVWRYKELLKHAKATSNNKKQWS